MKPSSSYKLNISGLKDIINKHTNQSYDKPIDHLILIHKYKDNQSLEDDQVKEFISEILTYPIPTI